MNDSVPQPSRLLHAWAILTVIAALPLLFLGAEVTTGGFGMVDPVGLRSPWYFIQEFLNDRGVEWKIEHGHRQVGWIVGNCVIVLVVLTWLLDRRRSLRVLSLAALAAVCLQGTLGILRIEYNAPGGRLFAMIHGAFAPIVFAMLLSMVAATSRFRLGPAGNHLTPSAKLKRWTLTTLGITYAQLVLGGMVRHVDWHFAARAHLLGAFVAVGAILWLAKIAMDERQFTRAIKLLLGLVCVQVALGVEAWLSKFFVPTSPWNQLQPLPAHPDLMRSLHYVVGTLVFATAAAVAVSLRRGWALAGERETTSQPSLVSARRLEGVA